LFGWPETASQPRSASDPVAMLRRTSDPKMKTLAYERLLSELGMPRLSESTRCRLPELELQAKIFSGEFGVSWRGEDGESIEILHFGVWNREPGPDFSGAQMLINGKKISGDIEIDQDVRDWKSHGHFRNASYDNVVLHVFVHRGQRRSFTSNSQNRVVSQVCLDLAKPSRPSRRLSNETIDETRARNLVEAAAGYRLRKKCEAFQRAAFLRGKDEALFQGIAAAMGFKNNKIPFLLVAQRTGLGRARGPNGEALLFGLSGFLKVGDFDEGDHEARSYLRELWEKWWVLRDRERRLVLPDDAWIFSAVRPVNHPHRRMGALAAAVRSFTSFRKMIDAGNPDDFVKGLTALEHPFWQSHVSLGGPSLPQATSLVGADRALDILVNVFLPARGYEDAWRQLGTLSGPTPSRKVLTASEWLLGASRPAHLRSAMCQQGLLQLAEDFPNAGAEEVWETFIGEWIPPGIVRPVGK
jgi:Protein of unknown function (DUF2851)